jgi:hypothetical protein
MLLPSPYLKKSISSSFPILGSYCGVLLALHIGTDIFTWTWNHCVGDSWRPCCILWVEV